MRSLVAAVSLAAISLTALAAHAGPTDAEPRDTLFPVMQGGQWGVVKADGTVVAPIAYDRTDIFKDGLIIVERDRLVSIMDQTGKTLVPFLYRQVLDHDYYGRDLSNDEWHIARSPHGPLIIDTTGKPLLGPGLGLVEPFDGKRLFRVTDASAKGVVSLDCDWVILPRFAGLGSLGPNGLAPAEDLDGRQGFVDADGKWVIEPGRFEDIGEFEADGLAQAKSGGKWGFIDASGAWVIEPVSEHQYWRPPSFDRFGNTVITVGRKDGVMRRDGSWLLEPSFDRIVRELDGSFTATVAGQRRRLARDGSDRGPAFDPGGGRVAFFDENGFERIVKDGKGSIIDRTGKEVLGSRFENVGSSYGRDWVPAKKGGKWGAVDLTGAWLLAPKYDCVSECYDADGKPPPIFTVADIPPSKRPPDLSSPRYTDPKSQDWCHAGD